MAMKGIGTQGMVLSCVITGLVVFSAMAVSTNASAAAVDGTWTSRIDGEGYTLSYLYFDGSTITDSEDAQLVVSSSGSDVAGTLTTLSESYSVTGTFDGTTFVMRLFWGWDGVTYCEGVYTLTVDGDRMYGSGSFVNVGVTINGYFDLVVDDPPIANAGNDETISVGTEYTFDGSGSSADVVNYTWTLTYDGQTRTLYGVAPSWTFEIDGEYWVTLKATDDYGTTATDTVNVIVQSEDGPSFPLVLMASGILLLVIALLVALLLIAFLLRGRRKKDLNENPPPQT
jgi:hypothetical protein